MSKQLVLEFPTELPEESLKDKEVLKKGKETLVMELLRKGEISQGKASELLGIDRWTLSDLMAKHNIPSIGMTSGELEMELQQAKRFFREK